MCCFCKDYSYDFNCKMKTVTMKKLILLSAIFGLVFLTNCGDDDDDGGVVTATLILTDGLSKTWRITEISIEGIGSSPPEACDADDRLTFSVDGTFEQAEGAEKCDPDEEDIVTGTWSFNADETDLNITTLGLTLSQDIIELTESRMVLRLEFLDLVNTTTYVPAN